MKPYCEFKLEAVSSTFIHGPDTKDKAQWRCSTFRGLSRYWFRALVGDLLDIDQLKMYEGKIFGFTDKKEQSQGIHFKISDEVCKHDKSYLLPHKLPDKRASSSSALLPGSTCTVKFYSPFPGDSCIRELRAAAWSFWLAASLGGFGIGRASCRERVYTKV